MTEFHNDTLLPGKNGGHPPGAEVFFDGLWHKRGAESRVFVYIDQEWRLSQKTHEELARKIRSLEKTRKKREKKNIHKS